MRLLKNWSFGPGSRHRKQFLIWFPYVILMIALVLGKTCAQEDNGTGGRIKARSSKADTTGTELIPDPVRTLLLASTLDGSLTAIGRRSGQVRWVTKDEPMIRVPPGGHSDSVKPPFFLPDPRSGSLYVLGGHGQLKKLPFTIPQLVSMAPCRSTEGLLYTGKKMDVWLSLDPLTGEKAEIVSFGETTCPASTDDPPIPGSGPKPNNKVLLVGKSQYTIAMVDGPRKWNVTFHDYSSVDMSPKLVQDYDVVHLTSPSTGMILTYDKSSSQLLWQSDLQSPIIALYAIDPTLGNLVSIPFTSVAAETLDRIKTPAAARDNSQYLPTLYVGECATGLYAVSSLVDDSVLTISSASPEFRYLLEGPKKESPPGVAFDPVGEVKPEPDGTSTQQNISIDLGSSDSGEAEKDFVLLGHYEIPDSPIPLTKQISASDPIHPNNDNESDPDYNKVIKPSVDPKPTESVQLPRHFSRKPKTPHPTTPNQFPPPAPSKSDKEYNPYYNILFYVILLICIVGTTKVLVSWGGFSFLTFRKFHWKRHGQPVKYLSGSNGIVTVGKLSYDSTSILGKGCEGTFVFKGKFENRDVAVKRVLPECFEFADREVDLLKESDQHANVIRYFCTETDGQFRYIGLELCSATMSDWVEGKFSHEGVKPMDVLKEATDGLAYLHSLRIVHRDIKPANVLLAVDPNTNTVRTMISDFGLCKKLATGRASFSRRSGGIPGTEGWIAPEMMRHSERTTYAVDVFSLGCIYYYVLTNGEHPFGDVFRRQSNILTDSHSLEHAKVTACPQGAAELIFSMISSDPAQRPPLPAIQVHPIFWSPEKILTFFLDVSDRIEKESEETCAVLRRLESEGSVVVRNDWRDHICAEVAMDLRKYRTYKGHSIRDLLRALRNKKNHYRELTEAAQLSLGHIPDQFVDYWILRFPNLLPYTWRKFESIKIEPIFTKYYPKTYLWNIGETDFDAVDDISPGNEARISPEPGADGPDGLRPRKKLDKDFWKSKNQYKYNKWKKQQQNGMSPNPNNLSPNRQYQSYNNEPYNNNGQGQPQNGGSPTRQRHVPPPQPSNSEYYIPPNRRIPEY